MANMRLYVASAGGINRNLGYIASILAFSRLILALPFVRYSKKPHQKHIPTLKPAELPSDGRHYQMLELTLQIEWAYLGSLGESAGTRWDGSISDAKVWNIPGKIG